MSQVPTHIDFRSNVQHVPPKMPAAVQNATGKFLGNRQAVVDIVGDEQWEKLRDAAHELRTYTLKNLDFYLEMVEQKVQEAGGHVHWARDAAEARAIVLQIARDHNVKRIVKVKSMISEEIGLNHALEEAGLHVRETDLGEYIIQLAGQPPSHIIGPAIHMSKEDVAQLFTEKLGVDAPPDPQVLAAIARTRLREEFLSADMGISGANFLVAETGTLVTVTNEGNGRMCMTVPKLHVAVTSIDKVVPDFEALTVLLKLLGRSGTGQKLTSYTTFITGPGKDEAETAPEEFHLVLVDNGRTKMLADDLFRQTLLCIRCGACMNTCPVYNQVGGHAYGWVYSGPIGAVLASQLLGTGVASDLPYTSTLCGACTDICPLKIPLHEMLIQLRKRVCEGNGEAPAVSPVLAAGATAGGIVLSLPPVYEIGSQALRVAQAPLRRGDWLPTLPPPINRWTMARPFPAFRGDFREWWRNRTPERKRKNIQRKVRMVAIGTVVAAFVAWLLNKDRP